MKVKPMPAAGRRWLIAGIDALLGELGATPDESGLYERVLATPLGPYRLSLRPYARDERLVSLFGRFDDHAQAASAFGRGFVNPHSGKCNWHFGAGDDPHEALSYLSDWLRRLMARPQRGQEPGPAAQA